jgi:pectate lyase
MHRSVRIPYLAALGLASFMFGTPHAGAATAGGMPANGSVITLTGDQTGHCLGVTNSSAASGARLRMQACSATPFQQWKVKADAAGDYQFANVGSGLCIDIPGASAERSVLQQWGCGSGPWQKWQIRGGAAGHYYITSKSSGLALEEDVSRKPGAVLQSAYTGSENQYWSLGSAGVAKAESNDDPIGFGAGTTGGAGAGHEEVTVTDPAKLAAALCSSFANNGICSDTTRRIIRISGVLDFRKREGKAYADGCVNTAKFDGKNNCKSPSGQQGQILNGQGACFSSKAPIYKVAYDAASDKPLQIGSNKTVIGVGANSGIKGKGLKVQSASNVIIRNLSITDINDGVVWGGDGISLADARNVWIADNLIARIGRQHVGTTGESPVQNVTISGNYFDGESDYGYYCNDRHYYVLLMNGANQTITIAGNRFHSSSGRSPEVGERGGIIHVVNNYYDNNYWTGGVNGTHGVALLVEGNYFALGEMFHPVADFTINKTDTHSKAVFAPIASNIAAANNACVSVLGRNCTANVDMGNSVDGQDFHVNPKVMSTIQSINSAARVIKSVAPVDPSTLPTRSYGPRADIVP